VKPVLAAVAKRDTAVGAAEVAKFWHESLGYAFQTGDTSPLKSVAGPGCEACQNYAEAIDGEVRKGNRYDSDPDRILRTETVSFHTTAATIRVVIITGQVRLFNPRTRKTQLGSKPTRVIDLVHLSWSGTRWLANHVFLDKK
jgi:hypothetical protein